MKRNESKKRLSNMEIASFCGQMAMILEAGISAIEGAALMLEEASSEGEKEILQAIYDTLLETGSFYRALEHSGVFPAYLLQMADIGEQTGRMEQVMRAMSLHYEREESIAKAIRSAVTYPVIMITMMAAVILVLITKVMPVFNQVFAQLGQEMTGLSKGLLSLGTAINTYSAVIIGVVIVLAAFFLYIAFSVKGRAAFIKVCCRIPAFRNLYEKTACCRFAGGMALTLSSGLNPDYCLELSGKLIDNAYFQEKLRICREKVAEGKDFTAALTEVGIFSGVYGRMALLASRTGSLDTVMQDIAKRYEEELDERLGRMIAVLEPALVILLSVLVGTILLSVLLPLMGIMSGL